MESLVVPPPHILEGRELDLLNGAPGAALTDQFRLAEAVDGLGEGVVIRVADGSGRGFRAELDEPVGVDQGE